MIKRVTLLTLVAISIGLTLGCNTPTASKGSEIVMIEFDYQKDKIEEELKEWNTLRKNQDSVRSIFGRMGNHFSFTIDSASYTDTFNVIQVYTAYNRDSLNFRFYIVPVFINPEKTPKMGTYFSTGLFEEIHNITPPPPGDTVIENNSDSISMAEAKKRVANWMDDSIRNTWLDYEFSNEAKNHIFQAFAIKAEDIAVGKEHHCYLALTKDTAVEGRYTPDIIVVNNFKVLNFLEINAVAFGDLKNIEDLVHSVPPFSLYPTTQREDFPILKNIK